ncbi:hypothetical protein L1887_33216 [Cichorium endivia]|nr:hypothetical protein L1887_33216 [Cichorium endivia]
MVIVQIHKGLFETFHTVTKLLSTTLFSPPVREASHQTERSCDSLQRKGFSLFQLFIVSSASPSQQESHVQKLQEFDHISKFNFQISNLKPSCFGTRF